MQVLKGGRHLTVRRTEPNLRSSYGDLVHVVVVPGQRARRVARSAIRHRVGGRAIDERYGEDSRRSIGCPVIDRVPLKVQAVSFAGRGLLTCVCVEIRSDPMAVYSVEDPSFVGVGGG